MDCREGLEEFFVNRWQGCCWLWSQPSSVNCKGVGGSREGGRSLFICGQKSAVALSLYSNRMLSALSYSAVRLAAMRSTSLLKSSGCLLFFLARVRWRSCWSRDSVCSVHLEYRVQEAAMLAGGSLISLAMRLGDGQRKLLQLMRVARNFERPGEETLELGSLNSCSMWILLRRHRWLRIYDIRVSCG